MQVDYKEMMELENEIKALETEDFKIYFRGHAMEKLEQSRGYTHCWALPFMVYIDEKGSVYSCGRISGREDLQYGNLYQKSFCEIWDSEERRNAVDKIFHMNLDENCGKLCRMDEMNQYLQELKTPGEHVNFI
jgi:radical SAM protein with 4Fe4S-binding SPASM domain